MGLPPYRVAERIMAAIAGTLPLDWFTLFDVDLTTMLASRLLAVFTADGRWVSLPISPRR